MEIRGKIDILLRIETYLLVEWGSLNLIPLQKTSTEQAALTSELIRIDAVSKLKSVHDALYRKPSLFDRVIGKTAEYYEEELKITKRDLVKLMTKAQALHVYYEPELKDLSLDTLALIVTHPEWVDPVLIQLGSSRLKTLIQAQQTGTMVLMSLSNCIVQCGEFIEKIDGLLSTTIPQWKLSQRS
jgi:hypothetical protein